MKKDIDFGTVKHVSIAITRSTNAAGAEEFHAYIINYNEHPIETVLISSNGYGEIEGRQKKTSTLRHMIEKINGCDFKLIEPIDPSSFQLTNEFWVSYYEEGKMKDKKFIFLPESVSEEYFQTIPWINKQGIVHD